MRPSAFLNVALAILSSILVASCDIAPRFVVRDLRGAWSPDGSSLLLVTSRYATSRPSEPYFYATSARNFEIVLSLAAGPAADPLAARIELDAFPEAGLPGLAQGGLPQYAPVYWFPEADSGRGLAFFGGRDPYARLVGSASTRRYSAPREDLRTVLRSHARLDDFGGLASLVADMEPLDSVPSPDGAALAVIYFRAALPHGLAGPMHTARALAFFDVATGSLIAVRPGWSDDADPWRRSVMLSPYFPLESEAHSYTSMSWAPDGSALLLYLGSAEDGRIDISPAGEWPKLDGSVLRIPFDSSAAVAPALSLPLRPLPSSSGPVSPSGLAIVLTLGPGNATRLSAQAFPPGRAAIPASGSTIAQPAYPQWASFGTGDTMPAAEWIQAYGFGGYNF